MIAITALAGAAAYILASVGGESRYFSAAFAIVAMCAATFMGA